MTCSFSRTYQVNLDQEIISSCKCAEKDSNKNTLYTLVYFPTDRFSLILFDMAFWELAPK